MINSNSLVTEIKERFPSFQVDPQFEDLITVIGGDMCDYIEANIHGEPSISQKIVQFVDEVVEASRIDTKLESFLSEIILGLYDLRDKSKYNLLREQLSPSSQQYFDHSVSIWIEGNSKRR